MIPYNGHRSKAAWNVSLWLNNDESLYNMCKEAKKDSKGNLKKAAAKIIAELHWMDIRKTPDGYTYTPLNVRLAIRD